MLWSHELLSDTADLVAQEVPAHLRRGIKTAELLVCFGRIIRIRPDTLSKEEQAVLHHMSGLVSEVAFSISHCWVSLGFEKYVALLVHFLGVHALIGGTLFSYVVTKHYMELPSLGIKHEPLWDVSFPIYHWGLYVGLLVGWSILLLGGFMRSGTAGFLDCSCIHQTDAQQKAQAIMSLPSYVKACKEFVVLWDEKYFTRMWCTYELGIFVATNPKSTVTVLPLRMTSSLMKMHLYNVGCFFSFLVMWPLLPGALGFLLATISAVAPLYWIVGREPAVFVEQSIELETRLEDFDAAQAECAVRSDKLTLVDDLAKSFEGRGGIVGFNSLVRSEIKERVLSVLVNARTVLSFRAVLIATCPTIPFFIGNHSSQSTAWTSFAQLCHAMFAVTHIVAVFLGTLAMVAVLASKCFRQSAGKATRSCRHLLLCNMAGVLIIAQFNVLGYLVPIGLALGSFPRWSDSPWHGPVLALAVDTCFILPATCFFSCGCSEASRGGTDSKMRLLESQA